MICVICADDLEVFIEPETFNHACPPVLKRFLGLGEGFEAPRKDQMGRLTFLKSLGILRKDFVACISFLRCEHVEDINNLVYTLNILGGSEKLDVYCANLEKQKEEQEKKAVLLQTEIEKNPMTPEQDTKQLFIWRARFLTNELHDDWSVTTRIDNSNYNTFWYRKKKN